MRIALLLALILLPALGPSAAHATSIDFRTATYSVGGANPDNEPFAEIEAGGITVRIDPHPVSNATLYWDSSDGFGVRHNQGGAYENDEIEALEILLISFWDSSDNAVDVQVTGAELTDLFNEDGYIETGWYDLNNDGGKVAVAADPSQTSSPATNGELSLTMNAWVHSIAFGAPGMIVGGLPGEGHEFSVAGIDFSVLPVPEPGSALLFVMGSGLIARAIRKRH